MWFDASIASFAVRIFFVVSGYLICRSWNSDPNIPRFFAKRGLRIFPALVMVVILSIFVLGPATSTLDLWAYFQSPATRQYFWNILLAPKFDLPGVFTAVPFPNAVNGSLWTLPVEFLMYLLVPIYGTRRLAICRYAVFPVALMSAFGFGYYYACFAPHVVQPVFYWTSIPQVARWAPYFLGGAAFAFWRLERALRLDVAVLLLGLLSCLHPGGISTLRLAVMVSTPYIVLAFCLPPDGAITAFNWKTDISYGTYLYAFPIQQTVIFLSGGSIRPLAVFAISLPVAYAFGWASWVLLERPALSFKPWRKRPDGAVASFG